MAYNVIVILAYIYIDNFQTKLRSSLLKNFKLAKFKKFWKYILHALKFSSTYLKIFTALIFFIINWVI